MTIAENKKKIEELTDEYLVKLGVPIDEIQEFKKLAPSQYNNIVNSYGSLTRAINQLEATKSNVNDVYLDTIKSVLDTHDTKKLVAGEPAKKRTLNHIADVIDILSKIEDTDVPFWNKQLNKWQAVNKYTFIGIGENKELADYKCPYNLFANKLTVGTPYYYAYVEFLNSHNRWYFRDNIIIGDGCAVPDAMHWDLYRYTIGSDERQLILNDVNRTIAIDYMYRMGLGFYNISAFNKDIVIAINSEVKKHYYLLLNHDNGVLITALTPQNFENSDMYRDYGYFGKSLLEREVERFVPVKDYSGIVHKVGGRFVTNVKLGARSNAMHVVHNIPVGASSAIPIYYDNLSDAFETES